MLNQSTDDQLPFLFFLLFNAKMYITLIPFPVYSFYIACVYMCVCLSFSLIHVVNFVCEIKITVAGADGMILTIFHKFGNRITAR